MRRKLGMCTYDVFNNNRHHAKVFMFTTDGRAGGQFSRAPCARRSAGGDKISSVFNHSPSHKNSTPVKCGRRRTDGRTDGRTAEDVQQQQQQEMHQHQLQHHHHHQQAHG
uniref:Uncharacterized protein n=1 Tax=Globodera rostochiensis TaxID=31243 RepID=A0A914HTY7_GLORO